jgi:hypothetical protein
MAEMGPDLRRDGEVGDAANFWLRTLTNRVAPDLFAEILEELFNSGEEAFAFGMRAPVFAFLFEFAQ